MQIEGTLGREGQSQSCDFSGRHTRPRRDSCCRRRPGPGSWYGCVRKNIRERKHRRRCKHIQMLVHLSTYLSRSPARLLSRINALAQQYAGRDLTLFFALSSNISDPQHLGQAVNALTKFDKTQTVGCLSGRLGGTSFGGTSVDRDAVSLAVAFMDSGTVRPFRSTIPGRDEVQVGRWHAFRKRDDPDNTDVEDAPVWGNEKPVPLPEDLRALE